MTKCRVMLVSGLLMMAVAAADVSGKWEVEAAFDDNRAEGGGFDCVFKQDADRLTGSCSDGTASLIGKVDGQKITWRLSNGASPSAATTFTGILNEAGTRIEGRFTTGDQGGRFIAAKL